MTTDDKLLLVGKILKVLLIILVFPILVVFELPELQAETGNKKIN